MPLNQIDYLKLIATGRNSIHYARPSDADDALTGLAGVCFASALILTFALAVLVSYMGAPVQTDWIGFSVAVTFFLGLVCLICGIFIGGAPRLTRCTILASGAVVVIALSFLVITVNLPGWYLYLPPFLFALIMALGAGKQI